MEFAHAIATTKDDPTHEGLRLFLNTQVNALWGAGHEPIMEFVENAAVAASNTMIQLGYCLPNQAAVIVDSVVELLTSIAQHRFATPEWFRLALGMAKWRCVLDLAFDRTPCEELRLMQVAANAWPGECSSIAADKVLLELAESTQLLQGHVEALAHIASFDAAQQLKDSACLYAFRNPDIDVLVNSALY
jgi:hypothetical protein